MRTHLVLALLAGFGLSANAQTSAPSPGTNSPTGSSNPAVSGTGNTPAGTTTGTVNLVAGSALEKGANSFTESQAMSRFEAAGLSKVTSLAKDGDGIWRASADRGGKSVKAGLDYKGNIRRSDPRNFIGSR